jgi:putative ABC transport system permease protein
MMLSESILLGMMGAVGGMVMALGSTAALTAIAARVLPDAGLISVDARVLGFSLALSLAASLLFGMAPALRMNPRRLEDALKHGVRLAGDGRSRLRQILASVQIALALVLLVAAGLLGQSFLRLRSVNPGFDGQGVLAASVALPGAQYPNEAAVIRFFDRALAGLAAVPGVRQAAMVSVVPMSGDFDRTAFEIPGKHFDSGEMKSPDRYIVSPGFFEALRIPLRQGRRFDARDGRDEPPVCIISETASRLWFPGESPIGKKIRAGAASGGFTGSPFREVVGVAGDVAQYGLGLPPTPQIYMPHAQFAVRYMTLLVRGEAAAGALIAPVRRAVLAADPEQPVYDVKPLEGIVADTIAARRLGVWLLMVFAASALTLAVIGVYAVVGYSVAQRTSEFGIRMALGARPVNIMGHALRDSTPMIAAGLLVGTAGSLAAARLIAAFLFGITASDIGKLGLLPVLLGGVALAASYIPGRRAAAKDPLAALRYE